MAREQIIIDVELNADEVANGLGEVAKRTSELKKENADLKKQMKAGTGDWAENAKKLKENELQLKTLKAAEKDLTGQLAATTQTNRTYSDSIDGVRAMTADLQRQYQSLTKAERESAGGKEMFNKLVELKQEVKDNAQAAGDFQDNVGNYPKVFDLSGTSIGKFSTMIQGVAGIFKKTNESIAGNVTNITNVTNNMTENVQNNLSAITNVTNNMTQNVQNNLSNIGNTANTTSNTFNTFGQVAASTFSKVKASAISLGKAFLTPPIGIIVIVLGAIMFAIQKLSAAFKKNDDASTKLGQAFAQFKPIAEGIAWVLDKIAVVVANLILGFAKMATAVLNLIPAYRKSAQAAEELVLAEDNLEETERKYTVKSAERNKEIARLKKEAVNTQKYTDKQIEDMLKKADGLALKNFEDDKKRKAETLRIIIAKAKQEKDTSDETANAIAQARAAMYQAEEAYYSETMRLSSKANAAAQRIEADRIAKEKEQAEEAEQRRKDRQERLEKELAERREIVKQEIKDFDDAQKAKVKAYADAMKAIETLKTTVVEDLGDDDFGDVKKYLADLEEAKKIIAETNAIDSLAYQQGILDAEYEQAIENAKKIGISTTAIDAAYAEQKKQISEAETAAKLDMASDFAGNLSTIFGESTKLGKAAAAAQIAIDTYKGALAAYASMASVPVVGQALGIVAAAAVGVKGAKAIKDVYSVKETFPKPRFAGGGIVGGSSISGDMINARVNSGEMILNLPQQKRLFDMIATTGNSSQGGIDYELLAKTMSKLPSPVVVYKEFSDFGEKIVTFDEQIKI